MTFATLNTMILDAVLVVRDRSLVALGARVALDANNIQRPKVAIPTPTNTQPCSTAESSVNMTPVEQKPSPDVQAAPESVADRPDAGPEVPAGAGEEAYSIAILLQEHLEQLKRAFRA